MLVIKPKEGEISDSSGLTMTLNGVEGSPFAAMLDLNGLLASEFALNHVVELEGSLPWELAVSNGTLYSEIVGDNYLLTTLLWRHPKYF